MMVRIPSLGFVSAVQYLPFYDKLRERGEGGGVAGRGQKLEGIAEWGRRRRKGCMEEDGLRLVVGVQMTTSISHYRTAQHLKKGNFTICCTFLLVAGSCRGDRFNEKG